MGATDLAIALPILATSGWLLYRSFFRRGGGCHGCSNAGSCGKRPRSDAAAPLVQLGGQRRS